MLDSRSWGFQLKLPSRIACKDLSLSPRWISKLQILKYHNWWFGMSHRLQERFSKTMTRMVSLEKNCNSQGLCRLNDLAATKSGWHCTSLGWKNVGSNRLIARMTSIVCSHVVFVRSFFRSHPNFRQQKQQTKWLGNRKHGKNRKTTTKYSHRRDL